MAALNRDLQARIVLERVWRATYGVPTPQALQAAQAIAHLESGAGYGAEGTSDGLWAGTNNWGAIKCQGRPPCDENCFEHVDSDEHGQVGMYCFRKYATPDEGARGLLHELLRRPAVRTVINSGSAQAIANAMHQPPAYSTLGAAKYGPRIAERAATLSKRLGEPLYVTLSGPSSADALFDLAWTAGLFWTVYKLAKGLRRRVG